MPSILQSGKAQADKVVRETPQSFTVAVHTDGHQVGGGVTYDRKWSNGFGMTAYLNAWWNDAAVTPNTKTTGIEAGIQGTKRF
jgi:hypothetical protein